MTNNQYSSFLEKLRLPTTFLLDGAMGTRLAKLASLAMNNEQLKINNEHPQDKPSSSPRGGREWAAVLSIHRSYLLSGADMIRTATFGSQPLPLPKGMRPAGTDLPNREACLLARRAVAGYEALHPGAHRYVAGSVGPTAWCCEDKAFCEAHRLEHIAPDSLAEAYADQAAELIESGVDAIMLETMTCAANARAALSGVRQAVAGVGRGVPVMLSFLLGEGGAVGMTLADILDLLDSDVCQGIVSVGINCCDISGWRTGSAERTGRTGRTGNVAFVLSELRRLTRLKISLCPSAGLPLPDGSYPLSPSSFRSAMRYFVEQGLVDIVGGCCGTGPEHIKNLFELRVKN